MTVAEMKALARDLEPMAKAMFKRWYEEGSPAEQIRLAREYPTLYAEYIEEQAPNVTPQC